MSPGRTAGLAFFGALSAAAAAALTQGNLRLAAQVLLSGVLLLIPLWPVAAGTVPAKERGLRAPSLQGLVTGCGLAIGTLALFHLCVQAGYWPLPPGPWRALGTGPLLWACGAHFVDVVLPEEVFFRGYLQPAWSDPERPYGQGLWFQAFAFGLLHVVAFGGQPTAMDRALPGLLFGAVRVRTGAIWASAILHLAFNLYVFRV